MRMSCNCCFERKRYRRYSLIISLINFKTKLIETDRNSEKFIKPLITFSTNVEIILITSTSRRMQNKTYNGQYIIISSFIRNKELLHFNVTRLE